MKILLSVSQCTCISVSLQNISRSIMLSSKVCTGSTSQASYQIVFIVVIQFTLSPQVFIRVFNAQHLTNTWHCLILILANFVDVKWHLTLLTGMILIITETGNLSICSWAFWVSSFPKYLFNLLLLTFLLVCHVFTDL